MAALLGKIIHLKIAPDEDNAGLKEADNKIGSKDSQLGSKWRKRRKARAAAGWAGAGVGAGVQTCPRSAAPNYREVLSAARKRKLCLSWRLFYCHGYKVI